MQRIQAEQVSKHTAWCDTQQQSQSGSAGNRYALYCITVTKHTPDFCAEDPHICFLTARPITQTLSTDVHSYSSVLSAVTSLVVRKCELGRTETKSAFTLPAILPSSWPYNSSGYRSG